MFTMVEHVRTTQKKKKKWVRKEEKAGSRKSVNMRGRGTTAHYDTIFDGVMLGLKPELTSIISGPLRATGRRQFGLLQQCQEVPMLRCKAICGVIYPTQHHRSLFNLTSLNN